MWEDKKEICTGKENKNEYENEIENKDGYVCV